MVAPGNRSGESLASPPINNRSLMNIVRAVTGGDASGSTEYRAEEKEEAALEAVFPCRLRILPGCIFNAKDPIVLGCEVVEGQLRVGCPLTVPTRDCDLGRVAGLEKEHKTVTKAERCALHGEPIQRR
jgi:translation initiation factor IF-2